MGAAMTDTAAVCISASDAVDVTMLNSSLWQPAGAIMEIAALKSQVLIKSPVESVAGMYARLPRDFEHFPAYKLQKVGLFLYHLRKRRRWCVSSALGSWEALASSESDSLAVADLVFEAEGCSS